MKFLFLFSLLLFSAPSFAQCNANFGAGYGINAGIIGFSNASTGSNLTYSWDFGDGGTSTLEDPEHPYLTTGLFNVCLTVTEGNGTCTDTYCTNITVVDSTICTSFFDPGDGYFLNNGNTVEFYNYQFGWQTLDFLWHFGDGDTSSQVLPIHTYSTFGTYTVCLEVSYSDGNYSCYDSTCQTIITIDTINSVENLEFEYFEAFPNPATEVLNISLKSEFEGSYLKLVDIQGHEIYYRKVESKQTIIPVSSLSGGLYFIQLINNSGRILHREKIFIN